jgi:uncharacterized protein
VTDAAVALLVGLVVGLSKTAIPGAGLLATPLVAEVFTGRAVPGAALLILLAADLFAVRWYRESTRWDLLGPLVVWVALGFAAGAAFFVAIGTADRPLEVAIAVILLVMVGLQLLRLARRSPPVTPTTSAAAIYGTIGGFTTFVSNNAGPVLNSYLLRLGLDKHELIGTSAWFYFAVNMAKIPIYLTLGAVASGGSFFTTDALRFAALGLPGVLVGVYTGRAVFPRLPQGVFQLLVLGLATVAAVRLLTGA